MPQLPQPRSGQVLHVKGRPLPFSKWPSRRGRLHYKLQSLIFARDPWLIIAGSINRDCPKERRPEALACLEQARDFFSAAVDGSILAARPLAFYYSFMNLAKAFGLTRGTSATFDQAQHGLKERRAPGAQELVGAFLRADSSPSSHGMLQNFAEFKRVLTGVGIPASIDFTLPALLPQIVPGHRFWALASNKTERFIALHDLKFRHDHALRTMWLDLYFVADDLTRLGVSQQKLLSETQLSGRFRGVVCDEQVNGRPLLRFEQTVTEAYPNGYPADRTNAVIDPIRDFLWATVTTTPPYRRYYVYMSPAVDHPSVLPQILSIYAIMFYLGSITRYRPHHYDSLVEGRYGSWIQEFVSGQPLQFLYLMASEFMRQDVTKPAIL